MDDYKRLTKKDFKKLNFYKKTSKFTKKFFKWVCILSFILFMFIVGSTAFFLILDSVSEDRSEGYISAVNSPSFFKDTIKAPTDFIKGEIDRESERSNIIAKEAEKNKEKFDVREIEHDFSKWNETCPKELIIVNKFNPINENFYPELKICRGKEVSSLAAKELENMICAAKNNGIILWISSAYRDFSFQKALFEKRIENELEKEILTRQEVEKKVSKIVAKPGESEHITGLAVDLNGVEQDFYLTREYNWLMYNAHNFGFIERFQKKWSHFTGIIFEPWHLRYVGKEIAVKIKESGLSLEEYIIKFGEV